MFRCLFFDSERATFVKNLKNSQIKTPGLLKVTTVTHN